MADADLERQLVLEYYKATITGLRNEVTERINSIQRLSTFVGTGIPALLVFIFPIYSTIEPHDLAPLLWLLPSLLLVPALLLSTADRTSIAQIALYLMQNIEHAADGIKTGSSGLLGYETWLHLRRKASVATSSNIAAGMAAAPGTRPHIAHLRDVFEEWGMVSVHVFFLSLCSLLTLCYTFRSVPVVPHRTTPLSVVSFVSTTQVSVQPSTSPASTSASDQVTERNRSTWATVTIVAAISCDLLLVLHLCSRFRYAMDCIVDPPEPILFDAGSADASRS